jgi:hypothetical protein
MTQFIGIYENAFSKEYCEKTIVYFDAMQKGGFTQNRQSEGSNKITKDDDAFFAHAGESLNLQGSGKMYSEFNETFWKIYTEYYLPNFSVLENSGKHNNYSFKIQKTPIGGGYHVWHYESDTREHCHRLLTWMVYLNDVG